MGDVVFETTENGLVPHSAWAGCSSHFLLEDLPNLRKRNPINPGNYKSFMVHMSRLRLFSIDKHFVKHGKLSKRIGPQKAKPNYQMQLKLLCLVKKVPKVLA